MKVLFLDDVRDPEHVLGILFVSLHEVTVCRSAAEALEAVRTKAPFDRWALDHDLGMEILGANGIVVSAKETNAPSGLDFLKWVVERAPEKWPRGCIGVHSANPAGKANMEAFIRSYERVTFGNE